MSKRILVAGIGNIFLGDDAFGVEAVRAFLREPLPAGVTARDFGIRGYDLAFALTEGYDAAVLVDAAPRGVPPGTLTLLQLDIPAGAGAEPVNGHSLTPGPVLRLAASLGKVPGELFLVGCEPQELAPDEGAMRLSPAVAAAIPGAAEMVRALCLKLNAAPSSILARPSAALCSDAGRVPNPPFSP